MSFFKIPALSVVGWFLFGCSVLDFRGIEVSTFPDTPGQVVPLEDPVTIRFSEPVERESTEALISIFGPGEEIPGTFTWEDELYVQFTPFYNLVPCIRYLLSLEGTLYGVSGKTEEISLAVPFYVGSDGPGLALIQSSPEHGSIVSRGAILEFEFSKPPDPDSFLMGFPIEPETPCSLEWREQGRVLSILPEEPLQANTPYTWHLDSRVRTLEGVPLTVPASSSFYVRSDGEAPALVSIQPCFREGSGFYPLPGTLADVTFHDSLMMTFSEEISFPDLEYSFSVYPALPGTLYQVSGTTFIFEPYRGFVMNTEYHITISTVLKDLSGHPLSSPIDLRFVPAIRELSVLSIGSTGTGDTTFFPDDFESPEPQDIDFYGPDLCHIFEIRFSRPFDEDSRAAAAEKISCRAFFPGELSYPDLENIHWNTAGTLLTMTFAGFEYSRDTIRRTLYVLDIPGGALGLQNQEGSFLPETVSLYIRGAVQ